MFGLFLWHVGREFTLKTTRTNICKELSIFFLAEEVTKSIYSPGRQRPSQGRCSLRNFGSRDLTTPPRGLQVPSVAFQKGSRAERDAGMWPETSLLPVASHVYSEVPKVSSPQGKWGEGWALCLIELAEQRQHGEGTTRLRGII